MFDYEYINANLKTHVGERNFKWISNNPHINRFYRKGEFYEANMLKFMCNDLGEGCLIDVGANIGNHSIYAAVVSRVHVEAFEPVYHAFVSANAVLNGVDNLVVVHNIGLGAAEERRRVLVRGGGKNPGATDLVPKGSGIGKDASEVSIVTLDSFKFEKVDVLKIDVEGMEEDVIRGASNLLSQCSPVIYAELEYLERFDRVREVLGGLDYLPTAMFNATPTFRFERAPVKFDLLPEGFRDRMSSLPKHKDY